MNQTLNQSKQQSYRMFDQIAGTYDALNRLLSMGIDQYWRNRLRAHLPRREKMHCLDLATGTADVAINLVKNKNVAHVTGMDLSQEMLAHGQKKIEQKNLIDKINLEVGNGMKIPAPSEHFDAVSLSFGIRNFDAPADSIAEIYRVLKPGGRFLILEFSLPKNILVRKFYLFYFRSILPRIGNLLSGHKSAYSYLNSTVESFPYGDTFCQLIQKTAPFKNVQALPLTWGIATLYWGDK